jgi:hypothetical protein
MGKKNIKKFCGMLIIVKYNMSLSVAVVQKA